MKVHLKPVKPVELKLEERGRYFKNTNCINKRNHQKYKKYKQISTPEKYLRKTKLKQNVIAQLLK